MAKSPSDDDLRAFAKAFQETRTERRPQGNKSEAGEKLGIAEATSRRWYRRARDAGYLIDPAIQGVMDDAGTGMVPSMVWLKTGEYSILLKPAQDTTEVDLRRVVEDTIEEALTEALPVAHVESRPVRSGNESLIVIDVADIHFGKLSVVNETGHTYDRSAAKQRVLDGVHRLVTKAGIFGVHRILFVLGDDVLHVDNAKNTTTSGTPQDTEGSIFQMYRDAFLAFTQAIEECAKVADVDLIHVPSNHDWIMGWALSQSIAAWFKNHPNVHSTPYNMSERHRKYYRFGSNLIGLSHGDGAKESSLYACMVTEAREHISECKNLYWLLHHIHHKVRKTTGLKTELREKDHMGLTVVSNGTQATEGHQIEIEYVRSPSPPDSWHDRNGFVNRQAVECFLYHPHDGQIARLTEFF